MSSSEDLRALTTADFSFTSGRAARRSVCLGETRPWGEQGEIQQNLSILFSKIGLGQRVMRM